MIEDGLFNEVFNFYKSYDGYNPFGYLGNTDSNRKQ